MVSEENKNNPPLWKSVLKARDEAEAQRRFEVQWSKEWLPKVRAFLRAKGFQDEELEDLQQETALRLWQALCRPSASGMHIGNMQAYAKRVAFSVLAEHLSTKLKRQPNKRDLLHRALDALNSGDLFAVWGQHGEKWCGLADRREPTARTSARLEDFQAGRYEEFVRGRLGNRAAQELVGTDMSRLPVLLVHLFTWIEIPIPVNELILHLTQLLNVADVRFESLDDPREREPVATSDKDLLADPFTREYLKQYGVFLCSADLTRCERGSTALVLTRDSLVAWLQISMTTLAEALGYSPHIPERFQVFRMTIWRRLPRREGETPLTDQQVAELLEIAPTQKTSSRQMVVNCRSITRNRKWPLWLKNLGWGE
ncbi:MAG: hypothetical protein JWN14_4504 [Chthonomonadales bacterium]|nr:hypothetical protein [Chthonomonadales bacterium]